MAAGGSMKRTLTFVNWAHALDHFVLLIFPTAVIAIAADLHRSYDELIWLATGAFVAFGLFALPVGWLADRFGRRIVLAWYFFGCGASCLLVGTSTSFPMLALSLLLLGAFSAIYHPIGSAMIVANATRLGHALGINGVWGNMGAALASGITGALAAALGWRAAFIVPGVIFIASGIAFLLFVKADGTGQRGRAISHTLKASRNHLYLLFGVFIAAILAGGLTFNIVTIAMPKVIDERFGSPLPLALTGWLTTVIFFCGAASQIIMGRLIDRFELTTLFIGLAVLQPLGLLIAAATTGLPMALGLVLVMISIYGQVVVNDAMIGRYVADELRNRVYSVRFFAGFTVAGLAVPLVGILHAQGGFQKVLLITSAIGAVIFASALATWMLTRGRLQPLPAPAQ
jgi:MFS family permease